MSAKLLLSRRRLLTLGTAGLGSALLAGCDSLASNPDVLHYVNKAETVTYKAQRTLFPREALAREFNETDISAKFKPNGNTDPDSDEYKALAKGKFADWRLVVDGLVGTPLKLSLTDLRALPKRTQITRHDCVEGWSCIGKWSGTPLSEVLSRANVKPEARYVVFHCADSMAGSGLSGPVPYYESIDMVDAYHPQTILAYDMNGKDLTVPYGAPLRLRVERQLGYKMAKYLMRIELVGSFEKFGDGNGGYWEDQGYDWYAGI